MCSAGIFHPIAPKLPFSFREIFLSLSLLERFLAFLPLICILYSQQNLHPVGRHKIRLKIEQLVTHYPYPFKNGYQF